jgi:hypothetical protein
MNANRYHANRPTALTAGDRAKLRRTYSTAPRCNGNGALCVLLSIAGFIAAAVAVAGVIA